MGTNEEFDTGATVRPVETRGPAIVNVPTIPARFAQVPATRPKPGWLAVTTTLRHFAIVTYAVPPERLSSHVDARFEPEIVQVDGASRALVSVVPFLNTGFRPARFWAPRQSMGQTNYRLYAVDRRSGERVAWFLGTTLDSWSIFVPRGLWKLPWHRGRMQFHCDMNERGVYRRYEMRTTSDWAPAELEVEGTDQEAKALPGFADAETGLVVVTHPLVGFYRRRDGVLGTYSVWHKRLCLRHARLTHARWGLLDRLGIVPSQEQGAAHSVLVQPSTEFTIYLPPRRA